MIRKPFAAFGRILFANYMEAGYTVDVYSYANSNTVQLLTEGSFTARDKVTGEVVYECVPGWFIKDGYEDRVLSCTANVDSVSWCYDPKVNHDFLPLIELLSAKQGLNVNLAKGTNLFLCAGTLRINGSDFVGPRQISVRSENVSAEAITDFYALDFK